MPPDGLLRHNGKWRVQCLTPNVCLTPVGSVLVPVPYACVEQGATAKACVPNVRYTGHAAFTVDSYLAATENDEPGTGGGVVSGVRGGKCEPLESVPNIRACGSPVVMDQQVFWMNERNCLAMAYYEEVPPSTSAAANEAEDQEAEAVPDKRTDYSQDADCQPAGGKAMTPEQYEGLQTMEQEKAMVSDGLDLKGGTDDVGCDDPGSATTPHVPDSQANNCPWRHCRNNCLTTRYGDASIPGIVPGIIQAQIGSFGVEVRQSLEAWMSLGNSSETFSSMQGHDLLCSNPLGRELAGREDLAGESCERLCAVELGGSKVENVPEKEPGPNYKVLKMGSEAVEGVRSTVDAIGNVVGEVVEAGEAAAKAVDKVVGILGRVRQLGMPIL